MGCLNNYNLDVVLKQLDCWCENWRGQIQTIFPSGMTQIEKIQCLFTAVKNTCEAQIDVMKKYCELYQFVMENYDKLYDTIYGDGFFELMVCKLEKWIESNIEEIIGNVIKFVFFGLTDDGYFIAYIPESWEEITFGTCMTDECFGRLTLTY